MNILVTGANGLIGSHCVRALRRAGHCVTAAVHGGSESTFPQMAVDFGCDFSTEVWLPRLANIDIVINTVGIISEIRGRTFEALHERAPKALFEACIEAGVQRIVQISALGADELANTPFHRSKKAADDFLLSLPISAVVVQPSLVFSPSGASTRRFAQLASAPVLPVPAGDNRVQPVALDDLVDAILKLIDIPNPPARIAAVGSAALPLAEYLQLLRKKMGRRPALVLRIPLSIASLATRLPGMSRIVDQDALKMLKRGNCADAAPFAALLGRRPLAPMDFVSAADGTALREATALHNWTPALRIAIAAMWIFTGIVSLGVYPLDASLAMLARAGVTGALALPALYGAALLDVALGIATLCMRRRGLWSAQILLIVGYTAVISLKLPEYWLHPYGPVLKNLPLLAAIALMRSLERR